MLDKPRHIGNTATPLSEDQRLARRRIRARSGQKPLPALAYCLDCGTGEGLVRHHEDYNEPDAVVILCGACHRSRHYRHAGVRSLDGIRQLINRLRG